MAEGARMRPVGPREVRAAAERIAPWVRTTPVLAVEPDALAPEASVVLKLELLQHTGSFKVRGAFNRLLASPVPPVGVVAASGGNFGLAVAYAAQRLGHRAVIFVPATSPSVKVERIRRLGADVHVVPGYYADALAASDAHARRSGALVLHAYDQPEVVAGQGTVAVELEAQAPALDTVLVAVGGGGLVGGVAAWLGGRVRVVGVEPEQAPTLHAALAAGQPVDVEVGVLPPTRSVRAGRGRSPSPSRSAGSIGWSWSATRPSAAPSAGCGPRCASWPSPVGRPPWRPCWRARTGPPGENGWRWWCAGPIPTPRPWRSQVRIPSRAGNGGAAADSLMLRGLMVPPRPVGNRTSEATVSHSVTVILSQIGGLTIRTLLC